MVIDVCFLLQNDGHTCISEIVAQLKWEKERATSILVSDEDNSITSEVLFIRSLSLTVLLDL